MNMQDLQRENVKIVDDNPEKILSELIADYEQRTGKTLLPAHIERLLINSFAYRETTKPIANSTFALPQA